MPNLSFGRKFGFRMDAMAEPILYSRFARERLEEALADSPVVLVHGPRQCGKTTLVCYWRKTCPQNVLFAIESRANACAKFTIAI
jgi:predicted AAA+ superfamily ATPase